jgi:hypothetical protein
MTLVKETTPRASHSKHFRSLIISNRYIETLAIKEKRGRQEIVSELKDLMPDDVLF